MIAVQRGAEPSEVAQIRASEIARIRALGRPPTKADIGNEYKHASLELWTRQHHKCCYCEHRVPRSFNDVEHYRPKAKADRKPGSTHVHGYWWLAFSWENLLFACPGCNRSSKNSRFPLDDGSTALQAEETPPGREVAMLLDPGGQPSPALHIQYVWEPIGGPGSRSYWWARPRQGSARGNITIDVCKLNRSELLELRNDYFHGFIEPQIVSLRSALGMRDVRAVDRELSRAKGFLKASLPHVLLAFDAFRASVPDDEIRLLMSMGWPPLDLIR